MDKGQGEPRGPRGSPRESGVVRGCPGKGSLGERGILGDSRGVRALREEGHQN